MSTPQKLYSGGMNFNKEVWGSRSEVVIALSDFGVTDDSHSIVTNTCLESNAECNTSSTSLAGTTVWTSEV